MNRIAWYGPSLILLVTVFLALTMGPSIIERIVFRGEQVEIAMAKDHAEQSISLVKLNEDFKGVSKIVEPSVVHIMTEFSEVVGKGDVFAPVNKPFTEIKKIESSGSGWVLDQSGHIVTNYHVVQNNNTRASKITVRFVDSSIYDATFIGGDATTDIAILKVNKENLHPASISKGPVEQGEFVFAFGSPYRFEFSMSQGIVSGVGRELGITRKSQGYENFIQTDAAINPGNSGGPLTNLRGEVVGMNTAILSSSKDNGAKSQGFSGLGFAIPVETIKLVSQQLIENGQVNRGYLGVQPVTLTESSAKVYGYEGQGGALIATRPSYYTPARKVDIRMYDIITHVNDVPIKSDTELRLAISSVPPGEAIKVTIFRKGQTLIKMPTLAKLR